MDKKTAVIEAAQKWYAERAKFRVLSTNNPDWPREQAAFAAASNHLAEAVEALARAAAVSPGLGEAP